MGVSGEVYFAQDVCEVTKIYELAEKLGVTVLTHVSAHGGGLYLYIPRDLVEAYKIVAGDKIEAQLQRLFKPDMGNVTPSDKSRVSKKPKEEEE